MKIAIYDPFKTFGTFVDHAAKNHDVTYIDFGMPNNQDREALHYTHDVVWYEFCLPEFEHDTKNLPKRAYVVNRVHGYEMFTPYVCDTNWEFVDKLVTVSPVMVDLLSKKRRHFDIPPAEVLFNGVNGDMFSLPPDRTYGKRIGVIGWINYKKNPPLALQCFEPLVKQGYEMHFIGESQDPRHDLYLGHMVDELGIRDKAIFHGKIAWEEVPIFCQQMDYIAHFAMVESFGQALMEAICCGNLPLIHRGIGIADRFGENGTWSTIPEFNELMATYEAMPDKLAYAKANREYVLSKFSWVDQLQVLDGILADIEQEVGNG